MHCIPDVSNISSGKPKFKYDSSLSATNVKYLNSKLLIDSELYTWQLPWIILIKIDHRDYFKLDF